MSDHSKWYIEMFSNQWNKPALILPHTHHQIIHKMFPLHSHTIPCTDMPSVLSRDYWISDHYEPCILAKSHRASYHMSKHKSMIPFALVHSDVWGPSPVITSSGHRWFVIFVDDCTRMTWLYLLKHKDEVFSTFYLFHTMIQTQFSKKIKIS